MDITDEFISEIQSKIDNGHQLSREEVANVRELLQATDSPDRIRTLNSILDTVENMTWLYRFMIKLAITVTTVTAAIAGSIVAWRKFFDML